MIEISTRGLQSSRRQHPAINNSDKVSDNTLLSVVRLQGKINCPQYLKCIRPQYQKKGKYDVNASDYIIQGRKLGYQINGELYIRVTNEEELEQAESIFKKYGISNAALGGKYVCSNCIINCEEVDFEGLRNEIINSLPNCLMLGTSKEYHSVSGPCGYKNYLKCPTDSIEDSSWGEGECPVYIYDVNTITDCIQWIRKAGFDISEEDEKSVYGIFGKKKNNKKGNNKTRINSYKINMPSIETGDYKEWPKNVLRICVVAENKQLLEQIMNYITTNFDNGSEIISNSKVIDDKCLMYSVLTSTKEEFYMHEFDYMTDEENDEYIHGEYIIVADKFTMFNRNDSGSDAELDIGEEGTAYCIISGELYEGPGWDDFMYTEEMGEIQNYNLNITDFVEFSKMYKLDIEKELKEAIKRL